MPENQPLTNRVKATRVSNAVAAGVTAINSSSVNMEGFEGVRFLVPFGTIVAGAATSVKIQQSSDDGAGDAFADVADTLVTVVDTDDDKVVIVDLLRPAEKHVRCVVSRAAQNSTVDGIIAEQYGPRTGAVTQDATTISAEVNVDKAEGTA